MVAARSSIDAAFIAARACDELKAENIVAFDVSERLPLTDVFVIASAPSERQVSAIVDEVERQMHEAGLSARSREGLTHARWVLLDYGDVVVHIMHNEDRTFYSLERLWKDCPQLTLPADITSAEGVQA